MKVSAVHQLMLAVLERTGFMTEADLKEAVAKMLIAHKGDASAALTTFRDSLPEKQLAN